MFQLDHLNMTVNNVTKSVEWYRKIFGFKLVEKGVYDGRDFAIIRSKDSMLCIYEAPKRQHPSKNETSHRIYHFALRTSNRKSFEETLVRENLKPKYIWEYPHSHSWYIEDPSGHEVEVVVWNDDVVKFG